MQFDPITDYPKDWTPWFSWYPVFVEDKWIWLETVERRCEFSCYDVRCFYQKIGPDVA